MDNLIKRVLEISYKNKLSHIGSCLTTLPILRRIFERKRPRDVFILSNGHAGVAQYVIHEHYLVQNAEELYHKHGVHPNKDTEDTIWASTGSLGHGLGIGIGYALSDRSRMVYVVISDGEMAEGSIYECMNVIKKEKIENIEIHINFNGWGANRQIMQSEIVNTIQPAKDYAKVVIHNTSPGMPFLNALDAHYYTMTDADYNFITHYEA